MCLKLTVNLYEEKKDRSKWVLIPIILMQYLFS